MGAHAFVASESGSSRSYYSLSVSAHQVISDFAYNLPTFISRLLTMLIPILKATLRPVIASSFSYTVAHAHATEEPLWSPEFWWKLGISMCLVLAGGVFAGYVFMILIVRAMWAKDIEVHK
jgi:hypothetical protein